MVSLSSRVVVDRLVAASMEKRYLRPAPGRDKSNGRRRRARRRPPVVDRAGDGRAELAATPLRVEVEAGGIEPPSESHSLNASTCVSRDLSSSRLLPRAGSSATSRRCSLGPRPAGATGAQPELRRSLPPYGRGQGERGRLIRQPVRSRCWQLSRSVLFDEGNSTPDTQRSLRHLRRNQIAPKMRSSADYKDAAGPRQHVIAGARAPSRAREPGRWAATTRAGSRCTPCAGRGRRSRCWWAGASPCRPDRRRRSRAHRRV